MEDFRFISIICPVYNESKYIATCIDSILNQDYPKDKIEVFFVDGMSTDGTRDILAEYEKRFSFIRQLDNPVRIVPEAMNIGIASSTGDVVIRLDAHATYPFNYFSALVKALYKLNADNVGAVCRTDVLNKTSKTLAIKEILSNRFGVGNSLFRIGIDKVREVDTVPFGCWKRDVFNNYGYYDTRLIRNQDIELNKRILRNGGHIYIIPDTYCTYLARESFSGIAKNNFANGKWNILTVHYTKQISSLSVRHFVPLLFVLSLLIPMFLSVIYHPFMYVSLFSLFVYLFTFCVICLSLSISKKRNFFFLLYGFMTLHIAYGCGSLIGLKCLLLNK